VNGLAAPLRVPTNLGALRVSAGVEDTVPPRSTAWPDAGGGVLLELLVFLRKEDVSVQQRQHVPAVAEALDFRFQLPLLLVLPVEDVAGGSGSRWPVGKADRLRGGEDHLRHEQLRRLGVVTAD